MKKTIVIIGVIICIGVLVLLGIKLNKGKQSDGTEQTSTDNSEDSTTNTVTTDGKMNVSAGSISGTPGTTVIVPVTFDTVPEKGVGSCNFNISYDSTKVEVVEVTPGDAIGIKASDFDYAIEDATGKISFLFASDSEKDAITKAGVFANIKFKIKDNVPKGDSSLAFGTEAGFGDAAINRINAEFKDGQITIN